MSTFQTQGRGNLPKSALEDRTRLNEWTMYPDTYGGAEFIYNADERLSIIMDSNGDCEAYYGLAEMITYYSSTPIAIDSNLEDCKAKAISFLNAK